MLDHVSITVSDIAAAERFYDAIMKTLDVVKVGRRDDWLGYGERARAAYPDRVYLTIRKGPKPEEAFGRHWCFKARWQTQVDAFWDAGIARVAPTTGRRARATITRPTMVRSCATPTATASRRCATTRSRARTHRHVGFASNSGYRRVTTACPFCAMNGHRAILKLIGNIGGYSSTASHSISKRKSG